MTIPSGFISSVEVDGWQLSPCCFQAVDNTALVQAQMKQKWYLLWTAKVIHSLYNDTNANTTALIRTLFPTARVWYFNPDPPVIPRFALVMTGERWILLVTPTQTLYQFLGQVLSSLIGCQVYSGYDAAVSCQVAAATIYGFIKPVIRSDPLPILYCGHSYGSQIATVVNCINLREGDPRWSGIISIGGPRHTGKITKTLLANYSNITRLITSIDPIIYFPPKVSDAAGLVSLYGGALVNAWASFEHPCPAKVITSTGEIIPQIIEDEVLNTDILLILAQWAIGNPWSVPTGHLLTTYISYLSS